MLPHIDDFLLNLQANHYSMGTAHNYEQGLAVFNRFLSESNVPFDKINKQTLTSYKEHIFPRAVETQRSQAIIVTSNLPRAP